MPLDALRKQQDDSAKLAGSVTRDVNDPAQIEPIGSPEWLTTLFNFPLALPQYRLWTP
jgi:hypothetical protein